MCSSAASSEIVPWASACTCPTPPSRHPASPPDSWPGGAGSAPRHPWQWRLLYVGRLHPDKGTEDAVRALTDLPRAVTLTFAGSWDPREETALAGVVAELGLQTRVTMLGQLPPERVAELYRSFDALVFPVRWDEPWGLVPLEAMACGCPVIATGRGGSGEYLRDGENCLLVPVRDPVALAAAVARLGDSAELRDSLRKDGIETAARYTEAGFNASVDVTCARWAGLVRAWSVTR